MEQQLKQPPKSPLNKSKAPTKVYKGKVVWNNVAMNWPGHFQGALHLSNNVGGCSNLKMYLNSLEGFLILEDKGKIAVTNGVMTVELDDTLVSEE